MKINKSSAAREDWNKTKSWNYKLPQMKDYQSVVYAEIQGDHGEVSSNNIERVYYIVDGEGEFEMGNEIITVTNGDVLTVSPKTTYNYHSINGTTLKVILFMELWDN